MSTRTTTDLETDRLFFRRHVVADFADCAGLWADPEVMRFIGGRPLGEEESWTRFLRYFGHWAVMGFGYWGLWQKGSGRFVGSLGFADYRRAIDPPLGNAPEIGWMLASWAQGQGYATEAVRAAAGWSDRIFAGRETCCIIRPDHVRSIRVAEKAGYAESRRALYKGEEIMVLTRAAQR